MGTNFQRELPIISVRGLTKSYGSHKVLNELDLDVQCGEILGVVGASGGGKSVLLRCIIGLEEIQAGTIEIMGKDTSKLDEAGRYALDTSWGVLFQDGALFGGLTVLQNIQVPMREHLKLPQPIADELAHLKIAMVGLAPDAANKYPSELSGGMRKRAGLARALALDPEIVFLDEPTAGLDPIGAAAFDRLIKRLQRTLGLTVYMVTHDLDSIFSVCDRVAVLADGKIVRTGAPEEIRTNPDHPWIESYFCGERARAATANI